MESGYTNDYIEGRHALLTTKHRKYLDAPEEFNKSDSARWKMHSRIRERLQHTICDFGLLGGRNLIHQDNNWEEMNLDKAFDGLAYRPAADGARAMFYGLYRGLSTGRVSFEPHLQDGVAMAEAHMNNRRVNPTFTIKQTTHGTVGVDGALSRINPEEVDSLRIPEMRAVLREIAESDVDIAELIWEERDGEPL